MSYATFGLSFLFVMSVVGGIIGAKAAKDMIKEGKLNIIDEEESNRHVDNYYKKISKNYKRVIYWSEDDNCWLVDVPELAGCRADGETPEEALKNAEIVIQEWIDTAVSLGRSIPGKDMVET